MPNHNPFLPKGYEEPEAPGNFLKYKPGKSVTIRILSPAMLLHSLWDEDAEGKRRKTLYRYGDPRTPRGAQFLWLVKVLNRTHGCVQLAEFTQKSIREDIGRLASSKWGSPVGPDGYDITIHREGSGINDTKYTVTNEPPEPLTPAELKLIRDTPVDFTKHVAGGDAFDTAVDIFDHFDSPATLDIEETTSPAINQDQLTMLIARGRKLGISDEQQKAIVGMMGYKSRKDIPQDKLDEVLKEFEDAALDDDPMPAGS